MPLAEVACSGSLRGTRGSLSVRVDNWCVNVAKGICMDERGWERKMNRTQALTPINTFCAAVSTEDFLLRIIISLYIYLEKKNSSGTYKICVRSCFVI